MIRLVGLITGLTIVASLMMTSVALAGDEPITPIPEARQARLLERFGDEGIDADGDGVLTHEEVHTLFADSDLPLGPRRRGPKMRGCGDCDGCGPHGKPGPRGACGPHGKGGPCGECGPGCECGPRGKGGPGGECGPHGKGGPRGKGGPHRGPGGRLGMMLHHLELLEGATPPPQFDLARHPEADTDGDGVLSAAEWTTFAAQERQRILTHLADRIPRADADNDGAISDTELSELKAWVAGRLLRRHPEADMNSDGILSSEEFEAFHRSRLEQRRARVLKHHPESDLDGDGMLSDEEIQAFHDAKVEQRGARVLECHPEADLDGNGSLSEEEIAAFHEGHPRKGWGLRRGRGHGMGPGCDGGSK